MNGAPFRELAREVERIFFEQGWPVPELLEEWDGESVEALESCMDPESYRTLLDLLMDREER